MTLIKHFSALLVLLPFFGALFSVLTFRYVTIAKVIALISVIASFLLSIYGLSAIPSVYNFGNWHSPIGIEYRLDYLNAPLVIYLNFVLLFFLLFCCRLTQEAIDTIEPSRQSLFYALLLFAHSGYLGMLATHDIFNLYVFIEISSLSTYALIAQGKNPRALIGAFDYLVLGTIGATLILIAIGMLFSITGSLNMSDIFTLLTSQDDSNVVMLGISLFLIGALLKIAFFPMHFWMIRAYQATAPIILTYIAGISSIVGIYVILRFLHTTVHYSAVMPIFANFIKPIALATILVGTYLALRSSKAKEIIIYSTVSQIGYIILLLIVPNSEILLFLFIFADSLSKIALFFILAYTEQYGNNKQSDLLWRCLVAFSLICSCGIPLSGMFIIKISLFELLVANKLWLEFFAVVISSCGALLYHYKVAQILLVSQHGDKQYLDPPKRGSYYGLIFINIVQFLFLILMQKIEFVYSILRG